MPGHELDIDLVDLRPQLRMLLNLNREQLSSQGRQARIGLEALEQPINVSHSLGGSKTEFRRVAADSIGQLCAIADQPIANADQHQRRLLLGRFHRHEPHRWPAHRLAKRFGICRVVLAALDVRLDQLRRDQLHRMPERLQPPRPMMGSAAGFDRNYRGSKLSEECHHFLAPQLLAQYRLLSGIHPVKLENVLRRIHPNSANLAHGRSPLSEISNDLSLARWMPSGAVHPNMTTSVTVRRRCSPRSTCWRAGSSASAWRAIGIRNSSAS